MTSLTLFVLCHNRPDFTRQALNSILAQQDQDFHLVLSDNSSTDELEQMMRAEFPHIEYRRRVPMLQPLAHFNRCIDEADTEYFCLFHDDDLMHDDFVQRMKVLLDEHSDAVACACNAQIETLGKIDPRLSFRSLGQLEWIASPRNLAQRYFARAQSGIAPFPSYVYRTRAVGEMRIPMEGGKYADVTWLLNLAMKGRMVWLSKPLMTYRMHGGNDGSVESRRDRLRFMAFLKQHVRLLGLDLLADYRCSFIYKPLMKNESAAKVRREVATKFLRHYNWSRYFNPALYAALLRRAIIKRVAE